MTYAIREVDPMLAADAETLAMLHRKTLGEKCPFTLLSGFWWVVYCDDKPVGFGGMKETTQGNGAYLCRSGVLKSHRGNGLQRRLIRIRERKAIAKGWLTAISDTTDNQFSANNLIASGYRLFTPVKPWGFPTTLYWKKVLSRG